MKYLEKTIEYGLYLLVFLLPIQTRWIIKTGELNGGYFEYGTYSLYATDLLLIIVLLLFIIREIALPAGRQARRPVRQSAEQAPRNDKTSNSEIIWWFIGGLLLMSAVSVLFAANKPLALYKFGWLTLGIGLFWLLTKAEYDRTKLAWSLFFGMAIQAVLGIRQFLTQSSFVNKWLGLALHQASDLGASVIEIVGPDGVGERWLRAYGGLDHPNILGGVMAIGILFLIGEIIKFSKIPNPNCQCSIKSQIPIANARTISNAKNFKSINWLLVPVLSAGLFFSFSRSAWLGLVIGLAVMIISAAAGRNLKSQKVLGETILVMGILLFILFSQYQNLIISRLGGEGRLENKSTSERLASYQESWQLIRGDWATGVGLGNYTYALSQQVPGRASFYYQPTHNVFLLVWSEIGIFGLLFFVGLLFAVGNGQKEFYNSGKRAAILIALAVIVSLDHWLFSLHFGVLFFWLILGLIESGKRDEIDTEKQFKFKKILLRFLFFNIK